MSVHYADRGQVGEVHSFFGPLLRGMGFQDGGLIRAIPHRRSGCGKAQSDFKVGFSGSTCNDALLVIAGRPRTGLAAID